MLEPGGLLALEVDTRRASLVAEIGRDRTARTTTSRCTSISPVASDSCSLGAADLPSSHYTSFEPKPDFPLMLDEKARELGRLIGQSSEYQAVKRANEALNGDRDAVALLRQMDQLRDEAQRMIERGENPTAEMEQQLDDLLSKVQVNSNYQRAIAAQENFDKTMLQVNNWITEGIREGRDELDHHARMTPRRGKLIVLEGAEGVGKTTQIRRLGETLTARGIPISRRSRAWGNGRREPDSTTSFSIRARACRRGLKRCCSWRRVRN